MEPDVSRERALDNSQKIMRAFIAEYKASPELWNPRDVNYTNIYSRSEAQERLLTILKRWQNDATKIDVRKKINTIRSNYNKKAGMVRAAKAEGRVYVPTNWMYHELRFLDTIVKPYPKVYKPNENEREESGDCIEEYADENTNEKKFEVSYPEAINYIEIGDSQESFEELQPVQYNGGIEPVEKKPKLTRHIIVDSNSQHHSPKPKPQIRRSEAKPEKINLTESNSAIEPIALVWSSKLRFLQPTQRLFAEKAINDILFEASLNNLQKGPMVINVGMSSVTCTGAEGFPVAVQEEYLDDTTDEGDVS